MNTMVGVQFVNLFLFRMWSDFLCTVLAKYTNYHGTIHGIHLNVSASGNVRYVHEFNCLDHSIISMYNIDKFVIIARTISEMIVIRVTDICLVLQTLQYYISEMLSAPHEVNETCLSSTSLEGI